MPSTLCFIPNSFTLACTQILHQPFFGSLHKRYGCYQVFGIDNSRRRLIRRVFAEAIELGSYLLADSLQSSAPAIDFRRYLRNERCRFFCSHTISVTCYVNSLGSVSSMANMRRGLWLSMAFLALMAMHRLSLVMALADCRQSSVPFRALSRS